MHFNINTHLLLYIALFSSGSYTFGQVDLCSLELSNATVNEMISQGFAMDLVEQTTDSTSIYNFQLDYISKYADDTSNITIPSLHLKDLGNDRFQFTIDQNKNGVFEDDTSIIIKKHERKKITYPIFSKIGNKSFDLPAVFDIGDYNKEIELRMNPLLKFKVVDHTIKGVDSILYYPQIFMPRIIIHSKKYSFPGDIVMYEPFLIGKHWYVLEHPDILNKTVLLKKLNKEEKPYGFNVNQYVHLEQLKSIVIEDYKKKLSKSKYTLHHFWGPWCAPCRSEFSAVQALNKRLQGSPVTLFNYCLFYNRKEGDVDRYKEQLNEWIEKGVVDEQQQITVLPNSDNSSSSCQGPFRNTFTDGCNPMELFNVYVYPTYVLVDEEGKILYRGYSHTLQNEDFLSLLDDILGD